MLTAAAKLIGRHLADLLQPAACVFCGGTRSGKFVCGGCHADLPWIEFACECCGTPLGAPLPAGVVCGRCQQRPPPFYTTIAPLHYDFPLDAAIKAAQILQPKYPDIQFVFVGSGVEVENLRSIAKSLDLRNVLFIPRKPINEIGSILRQADVLFVHLRKDPLFSITVPSKTQAYLAMGRPILIGTEGDAAELVEKAGAGVVCEPQNSQSIASGVESLYHMSKEDRQKMGQSGAEFYDSQLSFCKAVDHYEDVLEEIFRKNKK